MVKFTPPIVVIQITPMKLSNTYILSAGRTPLHMCCLGGFVECCRKFLQVGVDLDAQDNTGKTPLHLAAFKG